MNSCKIKITRELYAKLMEFQTRDFKAGGNKTVDEIAAQFIAAEINRQENAIMESMTKIELRPSTLEIMPPPLKKRLTKSRKNPTKNLKRKRHSKDSTNFIR